ncbi:hypothetical protein QQF64_004493 [Cirrhinus molitorella]|uniref:Uncharacterized protein n=1 Tax=Cirrhinus molitorella TaxID=172907 RepID=A0ABR3MJZ7_9TELE
MCRRVVLTSSGNTSNLFHHLKQFHPIEHTESQKMRHHKSLSQPVPEPSPSPPNPSPSPTPKPPVSKEKSMKQTQMAAFLPYDKQSKCHKDITRAVTNFLAKDMMPFSMVDGMGFRKIMSVIGPRFELPSRKYFSCTAIPALYGEVWRSNLSQCRILRPQLTSSRSSEPYLSLTVHFIDKDWNLVSLCLQTVYFPEDHTGEAIAAGLADVLAFWGLSNEQQVCITTDSGTNIIKAAELNGWTRLQWFRHRLNSAIGRQHGEYHRLVQELRLDDVLFQQYFRLDRTQFGELLRALY